MISNKDTLIKRVYEKHSDKADSFKMESQPKDRAAVVDLQKSLPNPDLYSSLSGFLIINGEKVSVKLLEK